MDNLLHPPTFGKEQTSRIWNLEPSFKFALPQFCYNIGLPNKLPSTGPSMLEPRTA